MEEISDNIEKATFNHFRMNVKKHELERIVNGSLKLNVKSPIVLQGHHTKKTRSPRNLKFKKNIQINGKILFKFSFREITFGIVN